MTGAGRPSSTGRSVSGLPVFVCAALLALLPALAPAEASDTPAPDAAVTEPDPALAEVRGLAESGTPQLALHTLDRLQPAAERDPAAWMAWERLRIDILRNSGRWPAIVSRLTTLPPGLPDDFVLWARTAAAEALVRSGQARQAIDRLQGLVWETPVEVSSPDWLPRWRRLLIEAYLAAGLAEDAWLASLRHFRDYPETGLDDRIFRARIALAAGRPDEAMERLADDTRDPRAGMLYLLAQLRTGSRPARKVMQAGLRQMRGKWADEKLKIYLWAVVAEAARQAGDRATAALALENVIAAGRDTPLPEGLFDFTPDSLWQAYRDYAVFVGNREQFLIGEDGPWFEKAEAVAAKLPVQSRALYALLLFEGQDEAARNRAALAFVVSARERPRGGVMLQRLFLESRHFADYRTIPPGARYVLADVALGRGDIRQASALMATLDAPPEGTDPFFWHLRRARIFVLGGDADRGAAALAELLDRSPDLTREQLDRLLQVVFDLQTVKANDAAYALFEKVLARAPDDEMKRELWYWMAESRKAQGRHAEAARLYLRSANYPEPGAMDPWGQTARYQAAEALASAGLVDDARTLFTRLLRVTRDAGRRALLQRQLQKLWLVENRDEEHEGRSGAPAAK